MKIIVTGGAGFIGSYVADYLVDLQHQVIVVDDLSGGFIENVNKKAEFYKLDIRKKEKTISFFEKQKADVIYHLAADATEGRSQFTPITCNERNLNGYLNVLVGAIRGGVKKVVLTSSMSVYGDQKPPFSENLKPNPIDIYGVSKYAMESSTKILSNVYHFRYSILRPHNVYGPRQNISDPYRNVIGIFINRLLQNKSIYVYGDGNQKRAFSYIDDVAPYIGKAGLSVKANNKIINIGSPTYYTIKDIAKLIKEHFPDNLETIHIPNRPQEVTDAYCTNNKAEKLLDYKQKTTIKEGINKTIIWARTVGPKKFKYLKNLELENPDTPITWKNKLL